MEVVDAKDRTDNPNDRCINACCWIHFPVFRGYGNSSDGIQRAADRGDRARAGGIRGSRVREKGRQASWRLARSKRFVSRTGVRTIPSHFILFERLINVVHEHAPQAKLCFNTKPSDTAEAVQRWKPREHSRKSPTPSAGRTGQD